MQLLPLPRMHPQTQGPQLLGMGCQGRLWWSTKLCCQQLRVARQQQEAVLMLAPYRVARQQRLQQDPVASSNLWRGQRLAQFGRRHAHSGLQLGQQLPQCGRRQGQWMV